MFNIYLYPNRLLYLIVKIGILGLAVALWLVVSLSPVV